jgi:endonuclease/exonuclease/phosphatase family metal-dependent hydrolase
VVIRLMRVLPVVRRAIHGYLGPTVTLVDELALEERPHALARVVLDKARRPMAGATLTVVSYNLKRAERAPGVVETLLRLIAEWAPDLVLLQEAPLEVLDSARVTEALGPHNHVYAPFHQVRLPDSRYPYDQYGQAVIARWQMERPQVIELPTVNRSTLGPGHTLKRIAVLAELPCVDGRRIAVVNIHHEPFARRHARLQQYQPVLEALESRRCDVELCCGDFNPTFSQAGEPGFQLMESRGFSNAFRGRWRALDTCFGRGHQGYLSAERLPYRGSDHRPIVVRIRL